MFFPFHPVPFYGQDYKQKEEPGTSYNSFFGLKNVFRKTLFSVISHLGSFYDIVQSGFALTQKSTLANLGKPTDYIIIIPVLADPLNLGIAEKKGKNINY